MLGSATLAIVVSSTCMIVASMIETVISPLFATAGAAPAAVVALIARVSYSVAATAVPPRPTADSAAVSEVRQAADVAGVDLDRGAHAGAQRRHVLAGIELDADRHALHDLDPVAGGVLRRQQRELRAGAGADRGDGALERPLAVGVDRQAHRLARRHVGEVGLLVVRLDPGRAGGDEAEDRHRRRHVLADLQPVGLADDAVRGRGDRGAREVELGRVQRGERLEHLRVAVGRDVGVAGEGGAGRGHGALGLDHGAAGELQLQRAVVGGRLADHAGREQRLLALVLGPGRRERLAGGRGLGDRLGVGRLQALDLEPGRGEPGLRRLDGAAVGGVVEPEQRLAGGHDLVLAHLDGGDLAADLRHDVDAVLLDVGVLGLDVAAAGHPDVAAAEGERQRQRDDEKLAAAALADRLRRRHLPGDEARRGLRLGGHGLAPAARRGSSSASSAERLAMTVARPATSAARSSGERPVWASS